MIDIRNPNGFGSVFKLSGNRRKPFIARKTVGYNDKGQPIYTVIGYFEKRNDAMQALAEFNSNPYDVDMAKLTLSELFEVWKTEEYPRMKNGLQTAHNAAYKHCKPLYDMPYKKLRKYQMQKIIDECGKGFSTRSNIKALFLHLDAYAYDHDIISKSYAKNLRVGEKEEPRKGNLWTSEEIERLWKMQGQPFVDETLTLLYTGMRVSEMLQLKPEHIDIDQGIIQYGIKTKAGRDRIIPIHPAILPLILERLTRPYLFSDARTSTAKDIEKSVSTNFLNAWRKQMHEYGFGEHHTHDCRKTFRSKLDSANANKVSIDLIMGHKSQDIGERVYTLKTIEELKLTVNLISYTLSDSPG